MSKRRKAPDLSLGVNLSLIITPMLDMAFQLMAFFIMTFQPLSEEKSIVGSFSKDSFQESLKEDEKKKKKKEEKKQEELKKGSKPLPPDLNKKKEKDEKKKEDEKDKKKDDEMEEEDS